MPEVGVRSRYVPSAPDLAVALLALPNAEHRLRSQYRWGTSSHLAWHCLRVTAERPAPPRRGTQ